ncbi:lysozyme [Bosea sp. TAF32]|uniref:lysozyme n=1 Tax=Bosea sp. TAF32 TaxID=3237482 RepID=UPI003F8EDBBB
MELSERGLALIKQWEGYRSTAYQCDAGKWTIGWGTTTGVQPGMKITKAQAERMLREDLVRFQACVTKSVHVPLTQGQYDALVSLCYNIGEGNDPTTTKKKRGPVGFRDSTLVKLLNQGRYDSACAQFDRWVMVGKKKNAGLQNRRDAEQAMFRSDSAESHEPVSPSAMIEATKGETTLTGKQVAAGATIVTAGGSAVIDKASDLADKHSSLIDTIFSSQALGIWCGLIVAGALAYLAYSHFKDQEARL